MKKSYFILPLLACLLHIQFALAQTNKLYIAPTDCPLGKTTPVELQLDNQSEVVALQFNLHIPDVVTLANQEMLLAEERMDGHTLSVTPKGDNNYLVILMSMDNKPFKNSNGALIRLPLTVPDDLEVGKEHPFTLSHVIISDRQGKNVLTSSDAGAITIVDGNGPDITPTDIRLTSDKFYPGGEVTVQWNVKNIGGKVTEGGWSERIWLVDEAGNEYSLGRSNYKETVSAQGSVARQTVCRIDNYPGIEGNVKAHVALTAFSNWELPVYTENNEGVSEATLSMPKKLSSTMENNRFEESNRQEYLCFLYRSGSRKNAETFTLTHTGSNRLEVPTSVTIPADESGISFKVKTKNDEIANKDSFAIVSITGSNYPELTHRILVVDDETPALSISAPTETQQEGNKFELTISRPWETEWPLALKLSTDHPKRFSFEENVTIPAHASSVTVPIEIIDDDIPDVSIDAVFMASKSGYETGTGFIKLADDDVPEIALDITPTTISEGSGAQAAVATLRRTKVTDNKITVKLTDNSKGMLYYPTSSITLEAGQTDYQFAIGITDNDQQEGDRNVELTAAVYISSCSCSTAGTSAGTMTKEITITDNDGPTLKLTSSNTSLIEGKKEATQLTVTRNTDTTNALTVQINSDHPDEVVHAATVTIPAGEASATIPVEVKSNTTTEGNRTITFTASANGFSQATCWAMITDQTLPDAVITDVSIPKNSLFTKEAFDFSFSLANKGSAELPENTKISIYLSEYDQLGLSSKQILLGNLFTTSTLAPDHVESFKRTFVSPDQTGDYYIIAIVDENQNIQETVKANNTSTPIKVQIEPLYTVQISTDKGIYKPGETIVITGQATGLNTAKAPVDVYIKNNSYQQNISVTTDSQGIFQYNYTPENWMSGVVGIGACYPNEGLTIEMVSVNIYGLQKGDKSPIQSEVVLNQSVKGQIKLYNPTSLPLTNLKIEPITVPQNYEITCNPLASLAGKTSGEISYTLKGTAVSENLNGESIKVKVTTDEGVAMDVTIYTICRAEKGDLSSDLSAIKTTMTKGSSREYPIQIINKGKGETGKISISLPDIPWLTLGSPIEMASLTSGESATVILRLQPTEELALNVPIEGKIAVNCANGTGLLFPFHITPVSESTGTLKIDVRDEATYHTAEKPHVKGASIRITTPTNQLVAEGKSDNNGLFTYTLQEGYYQIEVTAEQHDVYKNTILIDPGVETEKVVNLSMQGIQISYKVEETTIQDRYEIKMKTQFAANVPVPVIITSIEMPQRSVNNPLHKEESLLAIATLTNKGLITAQNVQLIMPENSNPIIFEPLIDESFDLPAQSSKTIPIKITYKPQGQLRANGNSPSIEEEGLFKGCTYNWGTAYFWDCGFDKKWHKYYTPVKIYEDCGEPLIALPKIPLPSIGSLTDNQYELSSGGGGFNPNKDYTASGGGQTAPLPNEDKNCIPCAVGMTTATLKCASHWIPAAEEVQAALELWDAFLDALKNMAMEESGAQEWLDNAYNQLSEKDKKFLEEQIDNFGIASFFGDAVNSLINCTEIANDRSFEKVMSCVSGLNESADKFFDQTLDLFFKKMFPKPTDTQLKNFEKAKKIGKKAVKLISKLVNAAACLNDFATACDHILNQQTKSLTPGISAIPGYLTNFSDRMEVASEGMDAYANVWLTIFGENSIWQECSVDELSRILRELPFEGNIIATDVVDIKPKQIPMSEWEWFIERWNNTISGKTSGNFIDMEQINNSIHTMSEKDKEIQSWGYTSFSNCIQQEIQVVQEVLNSSSNSVCSSISLQFSSSMTMTRQAFRGTLTVYNGHETIAMQNIRMRLEIKDENGTIATAREFQINPEKIDGFGGQLTGAWTLDAQKEGTATIVFIPSKYAAPTEAKKYSFGGTLSYIDPFTNLEVTRDLFPVTLTVNPSPNLKLAYFMQRDILGDDPLTTTKVEPSVPAEFALLIHNTGAGEATNVNMITNQPEIVDNEKGLAIQFELLSSILNGQERSLALGGSVATPFGNIPAGKTAYAQWQFVSSLLGHFTDYKVEATHLTSYDNPDLSLLDGTPTIHELIRSVKLVDTDLTGFLVNDMVDAEDTPDMIYLTDGSVETVSRAAGSIEKVNDTYTLTVTPSTQGWSYGSVTDPTGGRQKLVSITRQDGKAIDLQNVWQTGCTLRDGKDPLYENRIHFADKITGTTTYKLTFAPGPDLILDVASFEGVPDADKVAEKPVTRLTVRFNKAIEPATFTTEDIRLVLQGQPQETAPIIIQQQDEQSFLLDLTAVTKLDGFYVLTVQTDGITDQEGFTGESGKNVSWTQYLAPGFQTLSMPMATGWNWISVNMEGVSSPVSLLTPVKDEVKRMQSQSQEVINDPQLGLVGNLQEIKPETFYKLEMTAIGKIDITGTVLTPNQVDIPLKEGWNWIGYIPRSAATPAKALALLTASTGDEIKGQIGFAQYNGTTWVGTLDKMEPGKGYMYRAAKAQSFQYPVVSPIETTASLRAVDLKAEMESPWSVDIHKYPNNMSVIAELWHEEMKQEPGQYTVAAFCGEECRGIGKYVDNKIFMTVYGNKPGETITFRAVLNGSTTQWGIKETVAFSETTQGSLTAPLSLHLSQQLTANEVIVTENGIYPNPVSTRLYIKGETESIRKIQIVGRSGAVLMNQQLHGDNSIDVSPLSAGLYILILEREGRSEYHKFIKK